MVLAAPSLVLLTNQGRRLLLPLSAIPLADKDSCGDRFIPLKPEESVTAVVTLDFNP
ncbi:MAG: hypothetical protein HC890_19435 [Chloroflexaceae bacterium]|nr:hypothetical protein [Chloroflexaceae bacterium]